MRRYLRFLLVAALTGVAAGSVLSPATARADLHNIKYIARIDGVAPGSQATFVLNGNQTGTSGLSTLPGRVFEADTVLPDPQLAAKIATPTSAMLMNKPTIRFRGTPFNQRNIYILQAQGSPVRPCGQSLLRTE